MSFCSQFPQDSWWILNCKYVRNCPEMKLHFNIIWKFRQIQASKIEDVNHYILRTLTGHGKSLSYRDLLNICKLDTLECRKKQQSLILLFKCVKNIGPKYNRDFFSIRETSYNLRGNGVNLCVPKFSLNFMRNYFTYKCAQLCNKLPEDVKLADAVHFFKSKLRSVQL